MQNRNRLNRHRKKFRVSGKKDGRKREGQTPPPSIPRGMGLRGTNYHVL